LKGCAFLNGSIQLLSGRPTTGLCSDVFDAAIGITSCHVAHSGCGREHTVARAQAAGSSPPIQATTTGAPRTTSVLAMMPALAATPSWLTPKSVLRPWWATPEPTVRTVSTSNPVIFGTRT
jgi:hypothetical protein